MNQKGTPYYSVDIFKFIAAILIVAIHTRPFYNTIIDYYFLSFCRIGVPFFFIATSFFFFRKPNPDIKNYTKRLLTLYGLWFVIELPLVYHRLFIEFKQPLVLQLLNGVRSFLFSNTFGASWFIMACIISVNIVYYLSKKFSNILLLLFASGAFMISLITGSYYRLFANLLDGTPLLLLKGFCWAFCPTNSFIIALIYIVLGKIVAENDYSRWFVCKTRATTFFYLVLILIAGTVEICLIKDISRNTDAMMFLPPLSLLLMLLLLRSMIIIDPNLSRWLRNMSILIYLIHPILTLTNKTFGFMEKGPLFFIIVLPITMVLAATIIALSSKVPLLKKLY